jgi:hypothetical protein
MNIVVSITMVGQPTIFEYYSFKVVVWNDAPLPPHIYNSTLDEIALYKIA